MLLGRPILPSTSSNGSGCTYVCGAVCYHIVFGECLGVGPMFRVHSTRPTLPTDSRDLLFVLFSLCLVVFCVALTSQLVGMPWCATRTVRAFEDG